MKTYIQITIGTALAALGLSLFQLPNHLASGGLGGLLLVGHYLWGIPIGLTYFVCNLPILYGLYRIRGWQGILQTMWGTITYSTFLTLTKPLGDYAPTHNVLLATVYAGVIVGVGLGLTMRAGGSIGGMSAVAHLARHYLGMDTAKFILLTDVAVLALSMIPLPLETILYALITTFVMMKVIQAVQEAGNASRQLIIISSKPQELVEGLMNTLQRGVTQLEATGGYSGDRRPVLMCVVGENEVYRARGLILGVDPEAFVLSTEAREVSGRGFTLDTPVRRVPYWASRP